MRIVLLIGLLVYPILAEAQVETAHHRAVYKEINDCEESFRKVTGAFEDEPTVFALTGWFDGRELKKIVARSGDDGGGFEEYYLENERPLFVFSTYEKGVTSERVENRLYFKDGSIFKWLTTDKAVGALHSEDHQSETERLNANCAAFVAALTGKSVPAATSKVTTGVFLGIEEGDYFHWMMRSAGGEETSFFILHPDEAVERVLDDPDAFVGRTCKVTWKTSKQNIPEAGGAMELDQILSVEWSTEK